jgi:hypothetical protein
VNQLYFKELLSRQPLRVGPSIHPRRKLELTKIREENPEHYYALIEAFPHLSTTSRYVNNLAKFGAYDQQIEKYGLTMKGMKQMVIDNITDDFLKLQGFKRIRDFQKGYILSNRYEKLGHTYESAMRVAFIYLSKGGFSKPILLRNK